MFARMQVNILEYQFDLQKAHNERGKIFLSSFHFHFKRISFHDHAHSAQAVTMKSKTLIVLL